MLWSVLFLPTMVHAQVTRADYERAAGLRRRYDGLAVNIVDRPTWIGKTNHFWYRKSVKGGNEFVLVDAETCFLTGTAAAASIGLINSIGNLGGFAGPYVVGYLSKRTNSYVAGVVYLSLSALVAAGLVLSLRAGEKPPLVSEE